jgi:hypothetical protein
MAHWWIVAGGGGAAGTKGNASRKSSKPSQRYAKLSPRNLTGDLH